MCTLPRKRDHLLYMVVVEGRLGNTKDAQDAHQLLTKETLSAGRAVGGRCPMYSMPLMGYSCSESQPDSHPKGSLWPPKPALVAHPPAKERAGRVFPKAHPLHPFRPSNHYALHRRPVSIMLYVDSLPVCLLAILGKHMANSGFPTPTDRILQPLGRSSDFFSILRNLHEPVVRPSWSTDTLILFLIRVLCEDNVLLSHQSITFPANNGAKFDPCSLLDHPAVCYGQCPIRGN